MTPNQINYGRLLEDRRHNIQAENVARDTLTETQRHNINEESIGFQNAASNQQNADTNSKNANTNWYNAVTNRKNWEVNVQNAETNWHNAQTNATNAQTNIRNAATNERNAATNERNAATNEQNADTNALNAQTRLDELDANKSQYYWTHIDKYLTSSDPSTKILGLGMAAMDIPELYSPDAKIDDILSSIWGDGSDQNNISDQLKDTAKKLGLKTWRNLTDAAKQGFATSTDAGKWLVNLLWDKSTSVFNGTRTTFRGQNNVKIDPNHIPDWLLVSNY